MARIVAEQLVEALDRAGLVIMQRRPMAGGAAIGFGGETPSRRRIERARDVIGIHGALEKNP